MVESVQDLLARTTPKVFVDGAHRSLDPAETLARIAPHLAAFGITRVGNITGLDRIGIPVFVAVRPNSRSLSVSQGKGVDAPAARASAIMEAIEAHHAEFNNCLSRIESYAELRRRVVVADPESLPLSRGTLYDESLPIPWTNGFDLIRLEPVWVPLELVHANTTLPRLPGSGCFLCTTNGLAAGNTLAEAVLHGLCEAVERDACALWHHGSKLHRATKQLDLLTVDDRTCLDLLRRFESAQIDVMAWDVTSDIRLAVFRVVIFDRLSDPALNPLPAAFGAGCHPDRSIALIRALTEAAQSRLTAIAGSRDDLTRDRYRAFQAEEALHFYREMARSWVGRVDFRSVPTAAGATIEADLSCAIDAVTSAGIHRVVVVDLSRQGLPVAVARTIVPGLEGAIESPAYRPGPRVAERTH